MAIVQCIWNNPLFLDRSNTEKDIKLKRCSIDMLMPKCEVFFGRHLSPVACGRLTDIFMKSMLWVQYTYTFLVSNSRNAQNYTCIGPRFIAVTFHHASITKHKIKWCNIVYKLPDLFIFLIDTSLAPLGEISIPGCWTWSAEPPSSRWWPMLYPQHWISRTSGAALPCREWKKKEQRSFHYSAHSQTNTCKGQACWGCSPWSLYICENNAGHYYNFDFTPKIHLWLSLDDTPSIIPCSK